MEWSWVSWLISVAAVAASALAAWLEGNWRKRPGLGMGFVNHGGMWGDAVLLPLANAVIVPQLTTGPWIVGGVVIATSASMWVHMYWSRSEGWQHWLEPVSAERPSGERPARVVDDVARRMETGEARDRGDHMWPTRGHGSWWRDLSWSGWAHVMYVAAELVLLIGFLVHAIPPDVVLLVAAVFTIHVPVGLLQPRYFLSGHVATATEQPLLLPLLLALWAVSLVKIVGVDRLTG